MRLLVAGANGLGAAPCRALAAQGDRVRGMVRPTSVLATNNHAFSVIDPFNASGPYLASLYRVFRGRECKNQSQGLDATDEMDI